MEDILFDVRVLKVTLVVAFTVILGLLHFLVSYCKNISKNMDTIVYTQECQSNAYGHHYWELNTQFNTIQDKLLVLTTKHSQQINNLEEQVKHAKQRANIAESKLKKINQERRSQ